MSVLPTLQKFVNEVNTTNKTNTKLEILRKYPNLQEILQYVYCKEKFHVTGSSYLKFLKNPPKKKQQGKNYDSIYNLLDALIEREITGTKAKESIRIFIDKYSQYKDLILKILNKNLKIRLNVKNINHVFPDLIPVFEVALATEYTKVSKKIKKELNNRNTTNTEGFTKDTKYVISRKLDGVRCLMFIKLNIKGNVTQVNFFSRAGNEFVDKYEESTLTKISDNIKQLDFSLLFKQTNIREWVVDGEMCVINENNEENFKLIVSEIKTGVQNPKFIMFDILTKHEFDHGESKRILSERYQDLKIISSKLNALDSKSKFRVLEQIPYTIDKLKKLQEKANELNWEGLIIRKNTFYSSGRSMDLIKYKLWLEEDFIVKDITTGPFRQISKKTGLEIEKETMLAIILDFYDTRVGTGFSLKQRDQYYKNPELIIGKKVHIKFQEYTTNSNKPGEKSLRIPSFRGIRDYE